MKKYERFYQVLDQFISDLKQQSPTCEEVFNDVSIVDIDKKTVKGIARTKAQIVTFVTNKTQEMYKIYFKINNDGDYILYDVKSMIFVGNPYYTYDFKRLMFYMMYGYEYMIDDFYNYKSTLIVLYHNMKINTYVLSNLLECPSDHRLYFKMYNRDYVFTNGIDETTYKLLLPKPFDMITNTLYKNVSGIYMHKRGSTNVIKKYVRDYTCNVRTYKTEITKNLLLRDKSNLDILLTDSSIIDIRSSNNIISI